MKKITIAVGALAGIVLLSGCAYDGYAYYSAYPYGYAYNVYPYGYGAYASNYRYPNGYGRYAYNGYRYGYGRGYYYR